MNRCLFEVLVMGYQKCYATEYIKCGIYALTVFINFLSKPPKQSTSGSEANMHMVWLGVGTSAGITFCSQTNIRLLEYDDGFHFIFSL